MAKPYSMDLRQRAMDRLDAGQSSYEVASALNVAVSSVIKWAARRRATGSVNPGQMGGHRRPLITGDDRDWVLAQIAQTPHITLAALKEGLEARGLRLHPVTIGRFLHRQGKSFKKNDFSS